MLPHFCPLSRPRPCHWATPARGPISLILRRPLQPRHWWLPGAPHPPAGATGAAGAAAHAKVQRGGARTAHPQLSAHLPPSLPLGHAAVVTRILFGFGCVMFTRSRATLPPQWRRVGPRSKMRLKCRKPAPTGTRAGASDPPIALSRARVLHLTPHHSRSTPLPLSLYLISGSLSGALSLCFSLAHRQSIGPRRDVAALLSHKHACAPAPHKLPARLRRSRGCGVDGRHGGHLAVFRSYVGQVDIEVIRTPAVRAQWISSPSP